MPGLDIDFLVLIIVSEAQSKVLMKNLNKQHFFFTIIDSSNSLFSESTICLILGLNHRRIEPLDKLVRKYCQPYRKFIPVQMHASGEIGHLPVMESLEGGATLYGMPVEHFEQI